MVTVKSLIDRLQNELNRNTLGVTFNVYVDTGKYKKAIRNVNDVKDIINGITTVSSSDVSNTNDGLQVATMTLRTELLVKLKETEDGRKQQSLLFSEQQNQFNIREELVEEGNNTYIQSIRDFLDTFCANNEYYQEAIEENEGARTYSVSVAYSLIASGNRQMQSPIGDCYSFVLYGYYYIVEGGENSRSYEAYLDGQRIPFSTVTYRRVPSQEVAVYSGSKSATVKAINSNTVFGVSFNCPSFLDKFNSTIKNYILKGENNVAHILTVIAGEERQDYLVLFGEVDSTASGVMNVGQTITFVEAYEKHGIISPSSNLNVYQATGTGTLTGKQEMPNTTAWINLKIKEFNTLSFGSDDIIYSTIKLSAQNLATLQEVIE